MTASFGAAGTQLQGSASTMNVDVPDGVAEGHIIVVTAFIDSTMTVTGLATDFAHAPDSPVALGAPAAGGRHSMAIMWKRATGADNTASTYDFTLSASTYRNAQAIRYIDAVASGDPWDVTDPAIEEGTGISASPAVQDTTTVANTLKIWAGTNWSGGGTTTPVSSFTERRDSGDGVCVVADLAQVAAGDTGSLSATWAAADRMTAWLGALKPVAAATGSTPYQRRKSGLIIRGRR